MKDAKVRVSKTRIEWTEEAYKTESVLVTENGWNTRQGEIDELQKRIDEAIKLLSQDNVILVDVVAETLEVLKND